MGTKYIYISLSLYIYMYISTVDSVEIYRAHTIIFRFFLFASQVNP